MTPHSSLGRWGRPRFVRVFSWRFFVRFALVWRHHAAGENDEQHHEAGEATDANADHGPHVELDIICNEVTSHKRQHTKTRGPFH